MRLIVTTLVELSAEERAELREAREWMWPRAVNKQAWFQLAQIIGVTPRALFAWEYGQRRPTLAAYETWCRAVFRQPADPRLVQGVNPSGEHNAQWDAHNAAMTDAGS